MSFRPEEIRILEMDNQEGAGARPASGIQLDGDFKMSNERVRFPNVDLRLQDAIEGMAALPDNSFDLAIADPPYGASSTSSWVLPGDHGLAGFGGNWKMADHDWDMVDTGIEGFGFVIAWLKELKRLVKPTGSIWIHATYHNSGIANVACQILGVEIINEIIWYKRNAFPNLSGRRMTASHETILWVHTGNEKERKYNFNYDDSKQASFPEDNLNQQGKQLRTVWDIPSNKKKYEIEFGKHPTQKPLRVIDRMLLVSAIPNGRLLIPFAGSGTEVIAGLKRGQDCVAFETNREYFELASTRIGAHVAAQQAEPTLFNTEV